MKASDKQVNGDHYKDLEVQPIDYIVKNKLGWCEGNAVKYITRHRQKGGKECILKAIHYLELLIEQEYPETEVSETKGPGKELSDYYSWAKREEVEDSLVKKVFG